MRQIVLLVLLAMLPAGNTWAVVMCQPIEYAELKDMTTEEIQAQIKLVGDKINTLEPTIKMLRKEADEVVKAPITRENNAKLTVIIREQGKIVPQYTCDRKEKERFEKALQRRAAKETNKK